MFAVSDLIVEVRDGSKARIGQLVDADLDGFKLFPATNSVGTWQVVLPAKLRQDSGVLIDHPLAAVLTQPGAGIICTLPGSRVVSGPMTQPKLTTTTGDPTGTWTITGVTDEVVVKDAICFPQPANSDPTSQTVANDIRSGSAETVMRGLFSDNIGPTASAGRILSWLTCATDQGRGSTIQVSPRYTNMLDVFQTACTVGGINFQVSQSGTNLQLGFYVPTDRSASIRMDVWNDQLDSSEWGFSAPTVTDAYVGGQGDGTLRTMLHSTSTTANAAKSAWKRQIERFVDQRQTNDATQLAQAGSAALTAGGYTVTSLKVTPSSDSVMVVGQDWWLGDKVTVVVAGTEVAQVVTGLAIGVTADSGVLVSATVGDSVGFESDSVTEARLSDTEARVSALEIASVNAPCLSFTTRAKMTAVVGAPLQQAWVSADVPGNNGPWTYYPGTGWHRPWLTGEFLTGRLALTEPFILPVVGATYNASDYPDLAARYGISTGTFTVDNLAGRNVVVAGTGTDVNGVSKTFAVGDKGGEFSHALTVNEMPAHKHDFLVTGGGSLFGLQGGASTDQKPVNVNNSFASIGLTGGSQAHPLMQPYAAANAAVRI